MKCGLHLSNAVVLPVSFASPDLGFLLLLNNFRHMSLQLLKSRRKCIRQWVQKNPGRNHWILEFHLSKLSDYVFRYLHTASSSCPLSIVYCRTGMKTSSSLPVLSLGCDSVGPFPKKLLPISLCRAPLPSPVETAKSSVAGRTVLFL